MLVTPDRVLILEPMTPARWRATYQPHVRTVVRWGRADIERVLLVQVDLKRDTVYLPSYRGGDFIDGRPARLEAGTQPGIVRAPAIRIRKDVYFVLDGLHRLTEVRPTVVFLDAAVVARGHLRYFLDTINPYLKGKSR